MKKVRLSRRKILLFSRNSSGRPRRTGGKYYFASSIMMAIVLVATLAVAVNAQVARAAATLTGPALTVNALADRHFISPNIYGMNSYQIDPSLAHELKIPVVRWGGNATSRYN